MFGGNSYGELEFAVDNTRRKCVTQTLNHEPQRQVKNLEKFLGLQNKGPGSPSRDATEFSALESLSYQREISSKGSSGKKDLSKFLGVSKTSSSNSQSSKLESFQKIFSGLKNKMTEKRCNHRNVHQQIIGDGSLSTFEKRTKSLPRKLKLIKSTPKDFPTIQNTAPQNFNSLKFPIKRASAKFCHVKDNEINKKVLLRLETPKHLHEMCQSQFNSIKDISCTTAYYTLPQPPSIFPGQNTIIMLVKKQRVSTVNLYITLLKRLRMRF